MPTGSLADDQFKGLVPGDEISFDVPVEALDTSGPGTVHVLKQSDGSTLPVRIVGATSCPRCGVLHVDAIVDAWH